MQLCKYLPRLVNLSLHKNRIRDKKELAMIVPRKEKMINLRELVLTDNPLRENAYKAGQADAYRRCASSLYIILCASSIH